MKKNDFNIAITNVDKNGRPFNPLNVAVKTSEFPALLAAVTGENKKKRSA